MPQATFDDSNNGITIASECQLLLLPNSDIGAGLCVSYAYPEYSEVYNYECYSGSPICRSWCLSSESLFGRLMAYAAAIRWDSQLTDSLAEI